jgi:hypothetical protein
MKILAHEECKSGKMGSKVLAVREGEGEGRERHLENTKKYPSPSAGTREKRSPKVGGNLVV